MNIKWNVFSRRANLFSHMNGLIILKPFGLFVRQRGLAWRSALVAIANTTITRHMQSNKSYRWWLFIMTTAFSPRARCLSPPNRGCCRVIRAAISIIGNLFVTFERRFSVSQSNRNPISFVIIIITHFTRNNRIQHLIFAAPSLILQNEYAAAEAIIMMHGPTRINIH